MIPKCCECGKDHTDPEKMDGDWCWDCIDAEMSRSRDNDAVGGPVQIGNMKFPHATYRSRPPKFMLKPSEYKQYGY